MKDWRQTLECKGFRLIGLRKNLGVQAFKVIDDTHEEDVEVMKSTKFIPRGKFQVFQVNNPRKWGDCRLLIVLERVG